MVKTDFEILITGILVTILILVADIPATVNKLNELATSMTQFKNDSIFKDIDNFKVEESKLWARVKGVESNRKPYEEPKPVDEQPKAPECNCTSPLSTQTPPVTPITEIKPEKIQSPVKILLAGDSMMAVGFGPSLETKLLEYKDISVFRSGVASTGLNRVDYFDWYKTTDELILEQKPDVLVAMFGANDGQGILDSAGKSVQLENPQWDAVYSQRVNEYLMQFAGKVKRLYWIGHPIPKDNDPTNVYSFDNKFIRMNIIYKAECAKFPNVEYVDSWDRFAIDGKFAPILADDNGLSQLVKGSDGVHVTNHGGNILADLVIKNMDEIELVRPEP